MYSTRLSITSLLLFSLLLFSFLSVCTAYVPLKISQQELCAENGISDTATQMPTTTIMRTSNYTIQAILQDIGALMQRFTTRLLQHAPEILRQAVDELNNLAERVASVLRTMGNDLLLTGNGIIRDMFASMYQYILDLRTELLRLERSIDNHLEAAVTHLNETLMNNTEKIDLWTTIIKHDLRSVNDTRALTEACQMLDEFLVQSTIRLQNCCNVSMKPVQSLCQSTLTLLAKALSVVVDAVDHMQQCLEDKNSYLEYMVPCIEVAIQDVKSLIVRVVELQAKLVALPPVKVHHSSCCLSVVFMSVYRRPVEVEKDDVT